MNTAEATENRISAALWKARFATAILGNIQNGTYELINTSTLPLDQESVAKFNARGFAFLGVIALHEDGPRVALCQELEGKTISALSTKFLRLFEDELNARVVAEVAKRVGDEVEFLSRLHTLPDPRKGMEN